MDRGVRYATKRDREFGLYWGLKPTIESVVVWGEKPYAPEPLSCRPFYPRARRHRSTRIERSTLVEKDPFVEKRHNRWDRLAGASACPLPIVLGYVAVGSGAQGVVPEHVVF